MLKIIVDDQENITVIHEDAPDQFIPYFAHDELVDVLQGYNINTIVELTELGNTTTHVVADLLKLS